MTREEVDTIRSNAQLLNVIAEKITQLERVIADRGETFSRAKYLKELKTEYKMIDTAENRKTFLNLVQSTQLAPRQKIILYEYYFLGKRAKEIATEMFVSERMVYDMLCTSRKMLGIQKRGENSL